VLISILLQVSKKLNIKEDELSPILDGFKKRAAPDFESLAVSFSSNIFKCYKVEILSFTKSNWIVDAAKGRHSVEKLHLPITAHHIMLLPWKFPILA
jgi:hypothetical protein